MLKKVLPGEEIQYILEQGHNKVSFYHRWVEVIVHIPSGKLHLENKLWAILIQLIFTNSPGFL